MKCILTLDRGTISSRAILFNEGGNRLEWPLSGVLLNAYNRHKTDSPAIRPIRLLFGILDGGKHEMLEVCFRAPADI